MKKYTVKMIEDLEKMLRSLPPIEKTEQELSKQGAVRRLKRAIAELQQRGYNLEQIADKLRTNEFDIAAPTLRNYLQRAKPKKSQSSHDNQKSQRRSQWRPKDSAGSK